MKMIAITEDPRIDFFAKGEPSQNDFYYAGLFYNYQTNYMGDIAKYFYGLRERKKNVMKEFEDFLSKSKPISGSGDPKYSKKEITRWLKPWKIFKSTQGASFDRKKDKDGKEAKFKILELKVESASKVDEKSGLIFLAVKGYEVQEELSKKQEWKIRKLLMEEWMRLSESEYVKNYLKEVYEVYEIFEEAIPDRYDKGLAFKLAYYLSPIELDTFGEKVIVSKASLYKRKQETKDNLWKKLLEELETYYNELECILEEKWENLDYLKDYQKGENRDYLKEYQDYLENLLDKALSEKHLKLLREDWKKFLKKCVKGKSDKLKAVFLGKVSEENPPWMGFGSYETPSKEIELIVFAEEGFEIDNKPADKVVEILKKKLEDFKFLGNARIVIGAQVRPLEELFGGKEFFEIIKRNTGNNLKPEDSVKLIQALFYFATRLSNLIREVKGGKYQNKFKGVLLLLNTEFEEGDRYPLWNFVRFIYNYFGIPVQTLTKRSLREIISGGQGTNGIIKNLAISLYKDTKVLKVNFDGFYLPRELTIYVIVEQPSTRFFYKRNELNIGARHYLYEVYKITIEDKKAKIELEDKILELHGMRELGIERFIEDKLQDNKNIKFCLITALDLDKSKLNEVYNKFSKNENKFLLIRYSELKTAYFSEKTEQHCFIVYTQEIQKLMKSLGISVDEKMAAIALKPAHVRAVDDEMYHPALQLFFTERMGWERDEVYSERKSLFIFTVLALSMYESESYTTPFSKLDIWSKEKNYYLHIMRNEMKYCFPLKPVLYEMLKFIQERTR